MLCHRCHRKKSASKGDGTYRLSLAQVRSIRADIKAGLETKRAIAKKHKISYRYLHYLKKGEYRRDW